MAKTFAACWLLALGSLLAGPVSEPPPTPEPRHSFLEPVGDFLRDDILRPTAPFQLVPGKNPNGWSIVIEPYAWAMGLNGSIGTGGQPPSAVNFSSRTVLQNLDWGFFARGELRKGRWGLLADGYYAALSASGNIDNSIYGSLSLGVQQSLVSLALAYRVIDDRRGFVDVYAGVRYNFIGSQAEATLDDSVVNDVAAYATNIISAQIATRAEEAIKSALTTTRQAIADAVSGRVGDRALQRAILQNQNIRQLVADGAIAQSLGGGSARQALRDYIRAAVEARLAAARNQFDARLEAAATAAKKKLQQAIASEIEDSAQTYAAGNEWWFDPIVGLRGQVNLTRWLFLAAQGDVGGFGAGSQIAWNVQATIGVNFTRNLFAELGYRYMYVDYSNGGFVYDMNSFGLFSGLGVKF